MSISASNRLLPAYSGGRSSGGKSPLVDQPMIHFLLTQGFTKEQIVADAADLRKPDEGEKLTKLGFYHWTSQFGDKTIDSYSIGNAHPGGFGQTAAMVSDGSVTLTTFAGAYTQIIGIDKNGLVTQNNYT